MGDKSQTVRIPSHIVNRAEDLANRLDIPRTRAFEILYSSSNDNNFQKAIERAEKELYYNLILDFEEDFIKKLLERLHLGVILRKVLEVEGEERDKRLVDLSDRIIEFISEYRREKNGEERTDK